MHFRRSSIRAVDRAAVDEYALPSAVLMENAARAAFASALDLLRDRPADAPVVLCCGPGANAGDGFALARHLHNAGRACSVLLAADRARVSGDALTNLVVIERMKLPIVALDPAAPERSLARLESPAPALVVDALFGTGLDRPLAPPYTAVVRWINARRAARPSAPVLALDIPSGLDCDTGRPLGEGPDACVVADATITFCGPKIGFRNADAQRYLGRVSVGDIGAPVELLRRLAEPE